MPEFVGSNKRIAKNTILLYFRMGISIIVSLYTARIILSTLGDIDYGILNVVSGCVAIFTFLNGALSGSASRFLTFELGRNDFPKLKKTFSTSVSVHVAVAVALLILCETVGLWLLDEKLVIPENRMYAAQWAYQISIIIMVISVIQVPYGALVIAHEKLDVYAYMAIIDIVIRLLLVYLLQVMSGDKLILWSIMTLFISTIYTAVYIIYCKRNFKESKWVFHKDLTIYKKFFSYAWWNLIGSVSGMLQSQGISMILNMFYGPVINTARAISYQIQGTLTQFSGNFMIATKPQIIKLYASDKTAEMMSLVFLSGCLAFYLSWIFTLPLCLELPYVLKLWLGEYPKYTVSFTVLTLILGLLLSIKDSRATATLATGNIKTTNITVCIVLCLSFPISYFLLKFNVDPNYVLIATILITLIGEIIAVFILRGYIMFSVSKYWLLVYGRCLLIAAVSFVAPFCIHMLLNEGLLRLICVFAISVISVGLTVYILGINKDIRSRLIGYIKQIITKKHKA